MNANIDRMEVNFDATCTMFILGRKAVIVVWWSFNVN